MHFFRPLLTNVHCGTIVTVSSAAPPASSNVDVITPAGKMLARQLTVAVQPGRSLLVSGPNGCGKTSIFRWEGGAACLSGGAFLAVQQSGSVCS